MIDKVMGMIGLCRRAGKLSMGFDSAREAAQKGTAKLVLVTADASKKTAKEAAFFSNRAGVPCMGIPADKKEMQKKLHRELSVVSVNDPSFAENIQGMLTESQEEDCV